ncbi:MAG: hypothetical protein GC189_10680 [Alphaproteobacteria bacterium]|nr:hypothetical protein [Alphaproteobacteria bacterium]
MLAPSPARDAHAPPANRWRNFYRVYRILNLGRVGHVFPGVLRGPDAFPSKDIAETHARAFLAALNPPGRSATMEHAGAFPEGDAPN